MILMILKILMIMGILLQFDFKEGNYIIYNQKILLIQFHSHEESEHTIDGIVTR